MEGATSTILYATATLFVNTSSVYQITSMSLLQCYVIMRPMKSKNVTPRRVIILILLAWAGAFICSTIPFWLPETFIHSYFHTLFEYAAGLRPNYPKNSYLISVLPRVWIPYTIMAIATLATWYSIRNQMKKAQKMTQRNRHLGKKERSITKTILCIELGFAITTVPYVFIILIVNSTDIDAHTTSVITLALNYLYMSRSLANIFVYLIREKKFRQSIRGRFSNTLSSNSKVSTSSVPKSQLTTTSV